MAPGVNSRVSRARIASPCTEDDGEPKELSNACLHQGNTCLSKAGSRCGGRFGKEMSSSHPLSFHSFCRYTYLSEPPGESKIYRGKALWIKRLNVHSYATMPTLSTMMLLKLI